jgi:hypothetical protein
MSFKGPEDFGKREGIWQLDERAEALGSFTSSLPTMM